MADIFASFASDDDNDNEQLREQVELQDEDDTDDMDHEETDWEDDDDIWGEDDVQDTHVVDPSTECCLQYGTESVFPVVSTLPDGTTWEGAFRIYASQLGLPTVKLPEMNLMSGGDFVTKTDVVKAGKHIVATIGHDSKQ